MLPVTVISSTGIRRFPAFETASNGPGCLILVPCSCGVSLQVEKVESVQEYGFPAGQSRNECFGGKHSLLLDCQAETVKKNRTFFSTMSSNRVIRMAYLSLLYARLASTERTCVHLCINIHTTWSGIVLLVDSRQTS